MTVDSGIVTIIPIKTHCLPNWGSWTPYLQFTWRQSLDTSDRIAAHTIYCETSAVLTGNIPNEEDRVRMRQNYYLNAIRDVDQQVVTILEQIDRLGMAENTIIVFTSDHGDLLGSHGGLFGAGTTHYKQQNHVPLIIVHPKISGGQSCLEVTSHIDLVPTIVGLTEKSQGPAAEMMERIRGQDLSALLGRTDNPGFTRRRLGALFCFAPVMLHDATFAKILYSVVKDKTASKLEQFRKMETFPVAWDLRVCIRGITDERYKFARYFALTNFNTPRTMDALLENNDIELYDLNRDPEELVNLAIDIKIHRDLILRMNAKLNALIAREIGIDDGKWLPMNDPIKWDDANLNFIRI